MQLVSVSGNLSAVVLYLSWSSTVSGAMERKKKVLVASGGFVIVSSV